MNILVVKDISWDNYGFISTRINRISPEQRINCFYGQNLKPLETICFQNMLTIIRHQIYKNKIKELITRTLTHMKYCIIFHNFIEYNTISKLIIDACEDNCIPYFIFSEHCEKFYFNGIYIEELKFKKCIKTIEMTERCIKLNEEHLKNVVLTTLYLRGDLESAKIRIASAYERTQDEKKCRQIIKI